jgi:hypothetical protein
MSGMQGNQHRPAIRIVLREDLSKELSTLGRRGSRIVPFSRSPKRKSAPPSSLCVASHWSPVESPLERR